MDNDNQKPVQGLSRKLADFTVRLDLKALPQKVPDNAKLSDPGLSGGRRPSKFTGDRRGPSKFCA